MTIYQIKWRSDTAANWTLNNPTLSIGEPGYEYDTNKYKLGDGTSRWSTLPYFINTATSASMSFHKLLSGSTHTDGTRDALSTGDIIIRSSTGYWKRLGNPNNSYMLLRAAATATNKIEWDTVPSHTHAATWITSGILGIARGGTNTATLNDNIVIVTQGGGSITSSTITTTQLQQLTGLTESVKVRLSTKVSSTLFDAKGDVITACAGDIPYKTAVGSNGTCLTADSTKAGGVAWSTPGALGYVKPHDFLAHATHTDTMYGPPLQTGDIIIRSSTGYWKRLGYPGGSNFIVVTAATETNLVHWSKTIPYHTQPSTTITGSYHALISGSTHTDTMYGPPPQTGDIIIRSSTGYWKRLGIADTSYSVLRSAPTETNKLEWGAVPTHTHSATLITGRFHRLLSGSTHTDTSYGPALQTGDILVRSSTGYWVRIGGATTSFQVLSYAPTTTNKVAWKYLPPHTQGATSIVIDAVNFYSAATLNDVYDWFNGTGSSGRIMGGVLYALPSGGVAFSALKGVLKDTDSEQGHNNFFEVPAGSLTAGSLTDNSINYIYCDYNTGHPTVLCTTSRDSIKLTNQFNLGRAYKRGTNTEIVTSGICLTNFKRRNHEMMVGVLGYSRASGGDITQAGTTFLSASGGVFYIGSNKNTTSAVDTSAGGNFVEWFRDGVGGWNSNTGRTCLDNLHYDNNAAALATLSSGRYGVHWVYICYMGHINVVFGQGNYTLNNALAAARPSSVPDYLSKFAILAGKIIILKNAATFYQVTSAYETLFPMASVPEHNSLTGIQGGYPAASEYYHLSAATYTEIKGARSHSLLQHGTHTDTRGGVYATGDIIIRSSTGYWKRLGISDSSYSILRAAPTATNKIEWDTVPAHTHAATWITGIYHRLLSGSTHTDTSYGPALQTGDLLVRSSTGYWIRIGGATNSFQVLTWAPSLTNKVAWKWARETHIHSATECSAVSSTLYDAKGTLLSGAAANVIVRTLVGANGQILAASSTRPGGVSWIANLAPTHLTAKGMLISGCGTSLPYGTAVGVNGAVLAASSTKAGGISWVKSRGSVWLPAQSAITMTTGGASDAAPTEFGGRKVMAQYMRFNQSTDNACQWLIVPPTDYDAGSVRFRVLSTYVDATPAVASRDTRWGVSALCITEAATIGGGTDAWAATQYTFVRGGTGPSQYKSSTYITITPGGTPRADRPMAIKLKRDAANTLDTLNRDAILIGLLLEYTRTTTW